jgi:hypothetical protein
VDDISQAKIAMHIPTIVDVLNSKRNEHHPLPAGYLTGQMSDAIYIQ